LLHSDSIAEGNSKAGAGTHHPDKSRAGPAVVTAVSQKSTHLRQVHRAQAGLRSGWEVRSARPDQARRSTRLPQAHLKSNLGKDQGQKPELKCSFQASEQKPHEASSISFSCSPFSELSCLHRSSTGGCTTALCQSSPGAQAAKAMAEMWGEEPAAQGPSMDLGVMVLNKGTWTFSTIYRGGCEGKKICSINWISEGAIIPAYSISKYGNIGSDLEVYYEITKRFK